MTPPLARPPGPSHALDSGSRREAAPWAERYARRLVVTDLIAVCWAVFGSQLVRFGFDDTAVTGIERTPFALDYTAVSVLLVIAWMAVLSATGTRDPRVVGTGSTEYKRIAETGLRLFGAVAIIAYLFQIDVARGYILVSFPLGILALLVCRWIWRQWLVAERTRGHYSSRAIIVGTPATAAALTAELSRSSAAGYAIVGACILGTGVPRTAPWDDALPAVGTLEEVPALLERLGADTVIVTSTDALPAERVRALSWSLEPGEHHLVVAPSLTDIGGPRIHMRPVAGLPLMHVETPRYEGFKRFSKRAFDLLGSATLLLVLSPLLIGIAIAVRATSRGPVFFRQQRIGYDGEAFAMLKFRSMVVDAEQRLDELVVAPARGAGNEVLFKMRDDPRVTSVGRVLRRHSLDKLPQLLNVVIGQMSLVGPRPPLEREVAQYEQHVHRRFFVKPGVTGLWQVSGRSTLSWSDSVRLDLYYVENWSLVGDIVILWRTIKAVRRGEGAY